MSHRAPASTPSVTSKFKVAIARRCGLRHHASPLSAATYTGVATEGIMDESHPLAMRKKNLKNNKNHHS